MEDNQWSPIDDFLLLKSVLQHGYNQVKVIHESLQFFKKTTLVVGETSKTDEKLKIEL